jgi:hypothetical protein
MQVALNALVVCLLSALSSEVTGGGRGRNDKAKAAGQGCDATDDKSIRMKRVAAASPFQLALLIMCESEAANETHPHLKTANGCAAVLQRSSALFALLSLA